MVAAPEHFLIIPPSPLDVPPGHRRCSKCGQLKPLAEFYPRPTPSDPNLRHRQCKTCQNAKAREQYVADPGKARARTRARWAKAGEAEHEQHRAANRASYAQARRRAGRAYQPRLRNRKDPVLTPEEIHQLVRELAELARAELFANGFMRGSRAAGKESDLDMLLAPLARLQSVLQQILLSLHPSPTRRSGERS